MSLPGKIKLESVNQKMLLPKTTSTIPRQHHQTTVTQIQTNKRSSITGHHFVSLLLPRVYCVHTVCFSSLCSSVHSCAVLCGRDQRDSRFTILENFFSFSLLVLDLEPFQFHFHFLKKSEGILFFTFYFSKKGKAIHISLFFLEKKE